MQAVASAVAAPCGQSAPPLRKVRLGVVTWMKDDADADRVLAQVRELGFPTCQLGVNRITAGTAAAIRSAAARYTVEVTALLDLGPGRHAWDFIDGPTTVGLVPRETRRARIDSLKRAADAATAAGIEAVHTHFGFISENLNDPEYAEVVSAIREVAVYCKERGLILLCETGQETPITLLRTILDVGTGNLRVNLDTANLILYGKGNPVDALDVLGKHLGGIHAKDGRFPTDPRRLGQEVPIGRGKVDFPKVIARLHELGYSGAITIEREIEGPRQSADIQESRIYLEALIKRTYNTQKL